MDFICKVYKARSRYEKLIVNCVSHNLQCVPSATKLARRNNKFISYITLSVSPRELRSEGFQVPLNLTYKIHIFSKSHELLQFQRV